MKHVTATEAKAKAKFAELLDKVEAGETVIITRHGKSIARLEPDDEARRQRARASRQAIDGITEARKTAPRVTVEEILQWRDEGRRL